MRFRTILALLVLLLAADIILTSIAVGHLGATEMNPLYTQVGGLITFIAIKVIASAVAIAAIVMVERAQPNVAMFTAACCGGMYGGVFIWNASVLLS